MVKDDSNLRDVAKRLVGMLEGDSRGPTLEVPLGILRELDDALKDVAPQMTSHAQRKGEVVKQMIYAEEGGHTLVELLGQRSDSWGEYFKLRAVKTLEESRLVKSIPDGEEFEVSMAHVGGINAGWSLRELED